jgi:hypothetical protein
MKILALYPIFEKLIKHKWIELHKTKITLILVYPRKSIPICIYLVPFPSSVIYMHERIGMDIGTWGTQNRAEGKKTISSRAWARRPVICGPVNYPSITKSGGNSINSRVLRQNFVWNTKVNHALYKPFCKFIFNRILLCISFVYSLKNSLDSKECVCCIIIKASELI